MITVTMTRYLSCSLSVYPCLAHW